MGTAKLKVAGIDAYSTTGTFFLDEVPGHFRNRQIILLHERCGYTFSFTAERKAFPSTVAVFETMMKTVRLLPRVRSDREKGEDHFYKARSLAAKGQSDAALAEYRAAARLIPDAALVHAGIAQLLEAKGHIKEATRSLREAVRLRPDLAQLRFILGNLLSFQEHRTEAIAEYREALRLDPGHVAAQFNLANSLVHLGKNAEAREAWQKVLQMGDEVLAKEAQKRLNQIRQ